MEARIRYKRHGIRRQGGREIKVSFTEVASKDINFFPNGVKEKTFFHEKVRVGRRDERCEVF